MLKIFPGRLDGPRIARQIGLFALAICFLAASSAPVCAQAAKEAAAAPRQASAATVLAQIGRAAGVTIVADSVVGAQRVLTPREATTSANFEQQVAAIARQLPPGTGWAKLMLPAPPAGRSWKGDDVALFAVAASRLYGMGVFSGGSAHSAPPPGMSLLAQPIPTAKAAQYAADLHLQPVYVVANSNTRPVPTIATGTFAPAVGPQEIENALAALPPGPERDRILEEIKRNPGAVHIETDGNGNTRVMIRKTRNSDE